MNRRRPAVVSLYAVAMLVVAVVVPACDRDADVATPPPDTPSPVARVARNGPASTTTAAAAAATGPATTQAAEAMISIDGTLVLFPPAKIRLDDADGKVVARLFSDDPKHALDENYDGNSFYLQLEFDAGTGSTDPRELSGVVLTHRGSSTERDDSPYGIFLEGRRWVLQPSDVRVAFDGGPGGGGASIGVQLEGTFLLFDSQNETAKPKRANVAAKFSADVQARK